MVMWTGNFYDVLMFYYMDSFVSFHVDEDEKKTYISLVKKKYIIYATILTFKYTHIKKIYFLPNLH